jgi:hypothetical protein
VVAGEPEHPAGIATPADRDNVIPLLQGFPAAPIIREPAEALREREFAVKVVEAHNALPFDLLGLALKLFEAQRATAAAS